MTAPLPAPWQVATVEGRPPSPVVLVLGGFLTSSPLYRPFTRRLRARGAADVVVADVWLMDWLLAAGRGLGPIVTRSGRALLDASSRSERLAGGAPVLVIGHSAGGMSARLLTSPEPFEGRRLNGAGRIGAIVTLGTPHVVAAGEGRRNRAGAEAAAFANRVVPGPWAAPRTGYLAVTSRAVVGRRDGSLRERWAAAAYGGLAPRARGGGPGGGGPEGGGPEGGGPNDGELEGDGLIPMRSALLPGAPGLVLDDAIHGQQPGRDWYGSDRFLDQWWPMAVAAWEGALRARNRHSAGSRL